MLMLQNLKVRYTADSKTEWCESEWQLKNRGEFNELLTLQDPTVYKVDKMTKCATVAWSDEAMYDEGSKWKE